MEQERARIAQDLHDELGIGPHGNQHVGRPGPICHGVAETRSSYLEQMSDKAREMVTALDEIVWAMNPTHDSLASLVSYFSLYAERFLGLANIAWRLEGTVRDADRGGFTASPSIVSRVQGSADQCGATFRRHGSSAEHPGRTGTGPLDHRRQRPRVLPREVRTEGMDGVANMRARLEKLGGRFEITSETGRGTTVRFCLPS